MLVPKILLTPIKIRIFGPKTDKIGPKLGLFDQGSAFLALLVQKSTKKTMQTRCLGGFSYAYVPKLLLPPVRIRIFCPKRPNLVQNLFGHFGSNIGFFFPICHMPGQKSMRTRCLGGFFRYLGTKTFAFSSKN